jgi:dipeptidyl aminopeptidase/acylaminoacyl peptidase
MRRRLHARTLLLVLGALFALQFALTAQTPATSKRPISYDVVDYWKSIQGNRLSNDGQWLAYSVTSQAEDGELIVKNLRTDQQFKHPRGTGPTFTEDGKFLFFTIAQPKAEEEKEAAAEGAATGAAGEPAGGQAAAGRAGGGQAAGQGGGQGAGRGTQAARTQPRTGLGIMTLADGKVTTIEKVGSFRVPEESSAWLVYYKGVGGAGGGGGAAGGRGAGGRGGGAPPAATGGGRAGAQAAAGGRGQGAPGAKRKDPGSDLILRNLATGEEVTIPEVSEYLFDTKGTWLAYATSSTDAAKDGAFVRKLADGTVKTLMTGRGHYKSITFDQGARQIAFLSDQAEYEKPVSPYRVYLWRSPEGIAAAAKPAAGAKPAAAAAKPKPAAAPVKPGTTPPAATPAAPAPNPDAAVELVSAATEGMTKGWVVADAAPRFSRDGSMIYLSTYPAPPPPPDPNAKTPAPIAVDLWSTKDQIIQPMQKVRAEQERNRNYRAVVHLADKRFVQLATPELPTVNQGEDPARAIGMSDLPYRREISWDQTYNDVFLVDLKTAKAQKVLEHWGAAGTALSPGGKYVLYFDEAKGHWFTYRIADGVRTCLTDKLKVRFQQENNTPDLPGSYGTGGWTANDQSVLLYDEFDIWEVKPDGTSARMITNGEGRRQDLIFRYRSLDPEERTVPTTKPMLLSTTHERTRATGFYRVAFSGAAAPEKIVTLDKAFGALTKARKADTVVFTMSRFEEFPDLWVSSDTTFKDMKKVSSANPQQADYVWGRSELVEYVNADGKKLRAILTRPDNFDPTKKYPLMVYIYEELTNSLNSYSAPNVGTSINVTRYVSNGYVLLRPDIVYYTGYPGESAEKCVIPAVNTVVAMGFIDPKRIGIQGHSWGGYQITHLITRTDIFAAVEAGASVSNMISAYDGIRWGTGMVRQFQYEKTQSRIGAAPWDAPLEFIENSPIFWVKKVKTPYLTIHNDADDAVPWYQGIEFNQALRRLGKEAYMFSYNGEPHGLRNRDNMKHWTVHMDEFFDHYLLGKARPEWMDKGVSFLNKGTRDVAPMFKKKAAATTTQER